MDDLMERIAEKLSEEIIPDLAHGLTQVEKDELKNAAVARAKVLIAGTALPRGWQDHVNALIADAIAKDSRIKEAVSAAADRIVPVVLQHMEKAEKSVRDRIVEQLTKAVGRGY